MRAARRRDDEWDDGAASRRDGRRDPWQGDGPGGWPEAGGADGRYRTPLPGGGDWSGAGGRSADGPWPPVTGYQEPDSPPGYPPTNGHARFYPADAQSGYGPPPPAVFPGAGQGFAGSGYEAPGYSGTGYAHTAQYPAGYSGQGSTGYGYAGGYPDAGYAEAGWSGGGTADWRPDGEFPGAPATAQYGRLSSPPGLPNGEYGPAGQAGLANGIPAGTPRPYGRLSIFTLLEDKAAEFDWLAEQAAEGVRASEPDTLVYVIHVVPKAPMQRIIYEIYRDREAFESHERQPHIQRFVADRRSCVLATNIIDLRLKYAKVAALAGSAGPAAAASPASAQQTRVTPPFAQQTRVTPPFAQQTRVTPAAPAPHAPAPSALPALPALESGWPAEGGGRHAGPGYGRFTGPDERVPRSRPMDWDQPVYQGQRSGGN